MKIFLSYASQDRAVADGINRALLDQGHDVFFDRDDLPPGEEFHIRIRRAIEQTDLFVFLISEDALDPGSYTLNELEIAERRLRRPSGRLLPVLLRPTSMERLPAFVKSVTLLQSEGNVAAATAAAVDHLARARRRTVIGKAAAGVAALALVSAGSWYALGGRTATPPPVAGDSPRSAGGGATATAPSGVNGANTANGAPPPESTGTDGAPAVLVPAGAFVMGDDEESPKREIYLDAFYIDRYEVTTARYAKFLAATGGVRPPDEWETLVPARDAELPVVGVDWNDASAYCAWAGRRLPTDTEWEKAARGTDERRYPWGNVTPTLAEANHLNTSPDAYGGGLMKVGSHPSGRSPYGVHDLAGNANEWVADWFTESFPVSERRNPKGPASGNGRVIRGGGRFDPAERMVATKRYHGEPDLRNEDIGFRCARGDAH